MNRFYMAVTEKVAKENGYPKDGYISFVIPFTEATNVETLIRETFVHENVYTSKKQAQEVCDFWNECYKKNGTYAF